MFTQEKKRVPQTLSVCKLYGINHKNQFVVRKRRAPDDILLNVTFNRYQKIQVLFIL